MIVRRPRDAVRRPDGAAAGPRPPCSQIPRRVRRSSRCPFAYDGPTGRRARCQRAALRSTGENGIHVVPYGFSIIVTDLDTGGTLFSASYTKPGKRGGEPALCSNYDEILDPETGHLIAIDFTSLVHIRGN